MLKYPKILFHKEIISIINTLKQENLKGMFTAKDHPLESITSDFIAQRKSFKISFEYDRFAPRAKSIKLNYQPKSIPFKVGDIEYIFESLWFTKHSASNIEGSVNFFYTKGYSKKKAYYYRLVFLLTDKLDFNHQIEQIYYESDLYNFNRSATKAEIDGDKLIAYTFEDKENRRHYFAIESDLKQDFDTFSDKAFALKNAIGYLTGYLAGDCGYFFAYSNKQMQNISHYYYCSFRDTIKSHYSPIHNNPFAYLYEKRTIAEKLYEKKVLTNVPMDVLSTLANRLHSSLDFAGAIVLILESSIASLLFMPGGFAIVLETMADLIIGDDKLKLSPIKEKPRARTLRKKLMDIIEADCNDLPEYDLKTLKVRIDNLNNMTNGKRLKAPFDILKIELNDNDLAVLEARNDFLHGRTLGTDETEFSNEINRKNKNLYHAAMRYYTLLNLLILRWVGFKGFVINYAKMNEDLFKLTLKEPYYRK